MESQIEGGSGSREEALVGYDQAESLLGVVDRRDGQDVYIKNSDIKFSLDNVTGLFEPFEGDMLEMKMKILDSDKQDATSAAEVEVITFQPTCLKITTQLVQDWDGVSGMCSKNIYFNKHCLPPDFEPKIGSRVTMKIIDSFRDRSAYRAIQLKPAPDNQSAPDEDDIKEPTVQVETDNKLEITNPLSFEVDFKETSQMNLVITNKSDQQHFLNKWIGLTSTRDSQIAITPILDRPHTLLPGQSITLNLVCKPKFLGRATEKIILFFKGFQVKKLIFLNIVSEEVVTSTCAPAATKEEEQFLLASNYIMSQGYNETGRRILKAQRPGSVQIPEFPVPDIMWNVLSEDSAQLEQSKTYGEIIANVNKTYPFLNEALSMLNYADTWHTLIHMEEVQRARDLRQFHIPHISMILHKDLFIVEVEDLQLKRPALSVGDKAQVKYPWHGFEQKYVGKVVGIKRNQILIKFKQRLHDIYTGVMVSVDFQVNRSVFRRLHYAISKAIDNLGPAVLFSSQLTTREPQIPSEDLDSIEWCHTNLNIRQKAAVRNILIGECRPMSYCIYGPPGTGKTITVVETILQLVKHKPESRILVATPSNSAGNLIGERILEFMKKVSFSFIRIISKELENYYRIPEKLRPHCLSDLTGNDPNVDIPTEDVDAFLKDQNIIIGTFHMLGILTYKNFPEGYFTHVIIDEAGQATEPEIMIPLTLAHKENLQIIVAGDPMQLGPVVLSRYCQEYGMEKSYLSRIIDTAPYKKDFSVFKEGFNEKLVTRLNENYRSLQEVFTIPNEMFYDGSLLEKINRTQPWVGRIIDAVSDIFETGDSKSGGIYVYGIRGCNIRAQGGRSWYNPQEGNTVQKLVFRLLIKNVSLDEIGIITPYKQQIRYILAALDRSGLPPMKVGTVEEFQGREKPVIIISTVRSIENLVEGDPKHSLGFVKDPKRMNVAITRGQVVVILICDPHLLCTDPVWANVVNQAVKQKKYMGCDLPENMTH